VTRLGQGREAIPFGTKSSLTNSRMSSRYAKEICSIHLVAIELTTDCILHVPCSLGFVYIGNQYIFPRFLPCKI
jgi:hypothetical protein